MKKFTITLFLLFCTNSLEAQSKFTAPTEKGREVWNWFSYGTLTAGLVVDAVSCHGNKRCLVFMGVRVGSSVAVAETVKHFVPVDRPCAPFDCGHDNPRADIPSEHMFLAMGTINYGLNGCTQGPRLAVSLPLGLLTGIGRYASRRHDLAALAAGSAGGFVASVLTRCK